MVLIWRRQQLLPSPFWQRQEDEEGSVTGTMANLATSWGADIWTAGRHI